jgi:hypothetical protein
VGGALTYHAGNVTLPGGQTVTVGGSDAGHAASEPGVIGLLPHAGNINGLPSLVTMLRANRVTISIPQGWVRLESGALAGPPPGTLIGSEQNLATMGVMIPATSVHATMTDGTKRALIRRSSGVVYVDGLGAATATRASTLDLTLDTGTTYAFSGWSQAGSALAAPGPKVKQVQIVLQGGGVLNMTPLTGSDPSVGFPDGSKLTKESSLLVGNQLLAGYVLSYDIAGSYVGQVGLYQV